MNWNRIRIWVDLMWGTNSFEATVPAVNKFAENHPDVDVVVYWVSSALACITWWNVDCIETKNDIVDEKDEWWDINPLRLIAKWKESAIVQGINAVSDGINMAFLSRWNTGALVAYAKRKLWVDDKYAALSCWIPRTDLSDIRTIPSDVLFMDVWAEFDTNVDKLMNNVRLGVEYLRDFKWVSDPKISLLNAGSEAYKWDKAYRDAYKALTDWEYSDTFLWNIEPNRLLLDTSPDVIIAGWMIWNVVLKWIEWTFETTTSLIRKSAFSNIPEKIFWAYQWFQIKRGLWRFNPNNRPDGRLHGLRKWVDVVKVHGDGKPKAVLNGLERTLDDLRKI